MRDHDGKPLANVYFDDEAGDQQRRCSCAMRRGALTANIAKLPDRLSSQEASRAKNGN
jgi:hypothetical protein